MILRVTSLILTIPLILTYDKITNFRNRRMLLMQPHQQRKNLPFVIRVPYSKIVSSNPIFSHSVAWKAKQPPVIKSTADEEEQKPQQQQEQQQHGQQQQEQQQQSDDVEITQFHTQDTNGQVIFGFNSPDQMRIETRHADGTVHGTYSYLDPYGQVIKRQYWDTGSGFHVTSNTYPLSNALPGVQSGQQSPQFTPEVQAARDLHFQLYQQALASLLPAQGVQDSLQQNNTIVVEPAQNETATTMNEEIKSNDSKSTESSYDDSNLQNDKNDNVDYQNDNSVNTIDPVTQNGTIVIQNPEYLRISWTTENKKYRINLYNETGGSTTNKVNLRQEMPNLYNVTKFKIQESI